jgi:hypothetical protein
MRNKCTRALGLGVASCHVEGGPGKVAAKIPVLDALPIENSRWGLRWFDLSRRARRTLHATVRACWCCRSKLKKNRKLAEVAAAGCESLAAFTAAETVRRKSQRPRSARGPSGRFSTPSARKQSNSKRKGKHRRTEKKDKKRKRKPYPNEKKDVPAPPT